MDCTKSDVFADLPPCFREAVVRLDVEVTRGPSKGGHATVDVCSPCAGMLRLSTGLKVLATFPLPDPVVTAP